MNWHLPSICVSIGKTQVAPKVKCMYRLVCVCKDFQEKLLGGPALGLKWNEVDSQEPLTGTEIANEALSLALQEKVKSSPGNVELTNEEWDTLNVSDLSYDSYVKVGDSYFKVQVSSRQGMEDVIARLKTHRFNHLPHRPIEWEDANAATFNLCRWIVFASDKPFTSYKSWTTPSSGACWSISLSCCSTFFVSHTFLYCFQVTCPWHVCTYVCVRARYRSLSDLPLAW